MNCDRRGCTNEARWRVVLELRPRLYAGDPARMVTPLVCCDGCREILNVENVMDEEAWEIICLALKVNGKARPERERTVLIYWPIDS